MKRLIFIFGIFFLGCSAPTITANHDNKADFSLYKSFTFMPQLQNAAPSHPEYDNPEIRKLIKQAIINELTGIGYRQAGPEADIMVKYEIIIREMIDPRVDSAVIYKPWVDTKIDSFNYTEGLLVIRLIDRKEGKMVWQGSLAGILNRKPAKFEKKLEHYIAELFSSLPEHRH